MPAIDRVQVPFGEQIRFFRGKLGNLVPTQRWTDVWKAQHDRAFMVAGAAKADLLADFAAAVDGAIADGQSIGWFREQFDTIVAKHGWAYEGERNWRTRVIYQTNISTSYAAGRLAQLRDPELQQLKPYWMYKHNDSVLYPRPLHVSWDGLTLPADDPWFRVHYPPNGWGCKCYIVAVSEKEARRQGGRFGPPPDDGINPRTGAPNGIDKGWDYMPGDTVTGDLRRQIEDKSAALPTPLGNALRDEIETSPPAPPPPSGLPAFREARTAKEAERLATDMVSTGGGKDYATLHGVPLLRFRHGRNTHDDIRGKKLNRAIYRKMDVEAANIINRTLLDMQEECDRLNIPRIRAINNNAGRAGGTMGDGVMTISSGVVKTYLSEQARTPSSWQPGGALKDRPFLTSHYFANPIDRIKSILWHEFGHHIHQQFGVTTVKDYVSPRLEDLLRQIWAARGRETLIPTSYAGTNSKEWWAESYTLYKLGRSDLVDAKLLDLIQRIERGESV